MKHFNAQRPCAIYLKSNGPSYMKDEISELIVLPLTHSLQVHREIPVCSLLFRTEKQGTLSKDQWALSQKHGIDKFLAATLFERWYAKLELNFNKRILPVTFDWLRQKPFIDQWMGFDEQGVSFTNDFFSPQYRDILPVMLYWSEVAEINDEVPPFPKIYLRGVGKRLGVSMPESKTPLDYAFYIADVYDKLMSVQVPSIDFRLQYPSEVDYGDEPEDDLYDPADE